MKEYLKLLYNLVDVNEARKLREATMEADIYSNSRDIERNLETIKEYQKDILNEVSNIKQDIDKLKKERSILTNHNRALSSLNEVMCKVTDSLSESVCKPSFNIGDKIEVDKDGKVSEVISFERKIKANKSIDFPKYKDTYKTKSGHIITEKG